MRVLDSVVQSAHVQLSAWADSFQMNSDEMSWVTDLAGRVNLIHHHTWLFRRTQEILDLFSICSVHLLSSMWDIEASWTSFYSNNIQYSIMHIDIYPANCQCFALLCFFVPLRHQGLLKGRQQGYGDVESLRGVDVLGRHPVFPASLMLKDWHTLGTIPEEPDSRFWWKVTVYLHDPTWDKNGEWMDRFMLS